MSDSKSTDDSRDDASLRQFASRAQQPTAGVTGPVGAGGPRLQRSAPNSRPCAPAPAQLIVVFNDRATNPNCEIDGTRFNYIGTSPQISEFGRSCARRTRQVYL
jgi:hypothetical protein